MWWLSSDTVHGVGQLGEHRSGAVIIKLDAQDQSQLGFNAHARDAASFTNGVQYSMCLSFVNNNGVAVKAARQPAATASRSGQVIYAPVPPEAAVFEHVTLEYQRWMTSAGSKPPPALPRLPNSDHTYCKDAGSTKLKQSGVSFFPVLDQQRAAVMELNTVAKPSQLHTLLHAQEQMQQAATQPAEKQKEPFLAERLDAHFHGRFVKRKRFFAVQKLREQRAAAGETVGAGPDHAVFHPYYLNESVLHRRMLDNLSSVEFEGVQSSYVYIKEGFCMFNLHIEQMLFSFNHHQLEGESLWVIVPYDQLPKLYKLAGQIYAKVYSCKLKSEQELITMGRCMVLSKQLFLSPAILTAHGITFAEKRLGANEVLSAHGGCAHFGFSTKPGKTVSVATNSCTDMWLSQGLAYLRSHFDYLESLCKLRLLKFGSPRNVAEIKKGQHTELLTPDQLKSCSINNCPINFTCALLHGLYADLNLLSCGANDAAELTVCSYPTVVLEEVPRMLELVKALLIQIHQPMLRQFIQDHDFACAACDEESADQKRAQTDSAEESADEEQSQTGDSVADSASEAAVKDHTCMTCLCIDWSAEQLELYEERPDDVRQQLTILAARARCGTHATVAAPGHDPCRCINFSCQQVFFSRGAALEHAKMCGASTESHMVGSGGNGEAMDLTLEEDGTPPGAGSKRRRVDARASNGVAVPDERQRVKSRRMRSTTAEPADVEMSAEPAPVDGIHGAFTNDEPAAGADAIHAGAVIPHLDQQDMQLVQRAADATPDAQPGDDDQLMDEPAAPTASDPSAAGTMQDSTSLWSSDQIQQLRFRLEQDGYLMLRGVLDADHAIAARSEFAVLLRKVLPTAVWPKKAKRADRAIDQLCVKHHTTKSYTWVAHSGERDGLADERVRAVGTGAAMKELLCAGVEAVAKKLCSSSDAAAAAAAPQSTLRSYVLLPDCTQMRALLRQASTVPHTDLGYYLRRTNILCKLYAEHSEFRSNRRASAAAQSCAATPCKEEHDAIGEMHFCAKCATPFHAQCQASLDRWVKAGLLAARWHCDECLQEPSPLYTCWMPLTELSEKASRLMVLPRSHQRGDYTRMQTAGDHDELPGEMDGNLHAPGWLTAPADMRPGDLILFNVKLLHAASKHHDERMRLSLDTRIVIAHRSA